MKPLAGIVIAAVCALHLALAAAIIPRSNQDSVASDQGAEMWMAALSRNDALPQRTDGVRHPLFSWLVRHVYTADAQAFFSRGKWFNTILATTFLAAMGIWLARRLDTLALANVLLLSSLGILLVRGTYFQPEPLYYALFFVCCVMGWTILRGGSALLYPAFGFFCGLAFLAKPSLSPFLAAFGLGIAFRWLIGLLPGFPPLRLPLAPTLAALSGAILFAALITPLGLFSKDHFGRAFFNYPQVWMWMDDFKSEAWPWQDKHPGRLQLDAVPPQEWPSASTFFQRHSASHAINRLLSGTSSVASRFLFPEPKLGPRHALWRSPEKKWEQPLAHRGLGLLTLLALCGVLAVALLPLWRNSLQDPRLLPALVFASATVGAYTLLYGWYGPIGRGDRFMGSLWIPCVAGLAIAAHSMAGRAAPFWTSAVYRPVHALLLAWLLLQSASTASFFLHGGSLVTRN